MVFKKTLEDSKTEFFSVFSNLLGFSGEDMSYKHNCESLPCRLMYSLSCGVLDSDGNKCTSERLKRC